MFGVAQAPENNALSASFGWSVLYEDAEVRSQKLLPTTLKRIRKIVMND
jgi:hypothetical protein